MGNDLLVAVPSKGRAGRVTTLSVLPSATLYVPNLEVPAYLQMGAHNVVAVPDEVQGITKTRNWILRNAGTERVVMIDDDLKTQGWTQLLDHAAMRHDINEAVWLAEFRKLFELAEQLHYRIWGVATDGATRSIYPFNPFRWRSYVTASCMGIINDGRTYFDETYPVKEDYELCARCIKEDGGVVCAQYLYWVNLHWETAGGCKDYRTEAMERDCIRRLRRTYPGIIRIHPHNKSQWAIEIRT